MSQFIEQLRGEFSATRFALTQKAYKELIKSNPNNPTAVSLGTVAMSFDLDRTQKYFLPATAAMISQQFGFLWRTSDPEEIVSFDEFVEFSRDLSAMTDDDEEFEKILNLMWYKPKITAVPSLDAAQMVESTK